MCPLVWDMKGKACGSASMSSKSSAASSGLSGPQSDATAHCSVTDVRYTFSSGHSVWRYSSSQAMTPAAPPEVVVGQACRHAVVEDHAVFVAHQAVAAAAGRELHPGVGVDPVQELARVRA